MLRKVVFALCLGAAISLATTGAARAQFTTVPSGCPGGPFVLVPTGNFTVGTRTVVSVVPIGCTGTTISLFIGHCLTPPIRIPAPLSCPPGPCELSCQPVVTVVGPNPFIPLTLTLPNDPSLIGAMFCMQAACFSTDPNGRPCLDLGDKGLVTVQ